MNNLIQQAEHLTKAFHDTYWLYRDKDAVLDFMDEDIAMLGLGMVHSLRGKANVANQLAKNFALYPRAFLLSNEETNITYVSDTIYFVEEFFNITVDDDSHDGVFANVSSSIYWEQIGDTFKIKRIHMSSVDEIIGIDFLMENIPGGVVCFSDDKEMTMLNYNDEFLRISGYTKKELEEEYNNSYALLIHSEDIEMVQELFSIQKKIGNKVRLDYRLIGKSGAKHTIINIMEYGQVVLHDGKRRIYSILIDVTETQVLISKLNDVAKMNETIVELSSDIVFQWNPMENEISFSENWIDKFGYSPYTKNIYETIIDKKLVYADDIDALKLFMQQLLHKGTSLTTELRIYRADNTYIWCRLKASMQVDDSGNITECVGVIVDIDDAKAEADTLRRQAESDALTGLYNKSTTERLSRVYLRSLDDHSKCAFIIVDLDNFKSVNDVYGHPRGDMLLSDFAKELMRIFRKEDIIGRLGGDEFGILMKDIPNVEIVKSKADEILNAINKISEKNNYEVSGSIGIACSSSCDNSYSRLYHNADLSLYYVKTRGKNDYFVFDEECLDEEALLEERKVIPKREDPDALVHFV
ncbi:MAG: diguanylate cyclase [Suipraeoptans sp.]